MLTTRHLTTTSKQQGFTLVELSIVLVVIGLVVAGILMGQDLVRAAQLRSLSSQQEQFTAAIRTFQIKYGQLPGDMSPERAAELGLFTFTGANAGSAFGLGNNNGIIESNYIEYACIYECGAIWSHLSSAELLDGSYGQNLHADTTTPCTGAPEGESDPLCSNFTNALYMPAAKGLSNTYWGANHLYYSAHFQPSSTINLRQNLFYLLRKGSAAVSYRNQPSLSAIDTHQIDAKIDDGLPNSGRVLASTVQGFSYTYWTSSLANNHNVCTYGGLFNARTPDARYNTDPNTGGTNITCIPLFLWR